MGQIAFVFSGQGAQHVGMGRELYEQSPRVKALFDRAEACRPGTLAQMFDGQEETLRATENAQPCLYLADLAPAIVLQELGVEPHAVAGFSLGELPALAFAGAYSSADGFALACRRGELMGRETHKHHTAMAAVMKLTNEQVEQACRAFEHVWPVNYNCPGQLVVAGDAAELAAFIQAVTELGGRCIPLKVAGAFHSPYMDPAADAFRAVLKSFPLTEPRLPVYSDYTARPYEPALMREWLGHQLNHPVRWEELVRNLAAAGVDTFVETGVGTVLQKLIGKILPECRCYAAESMDECRAVAEVLCHA
ncbi:MAG: ACP S-malonyltransferase [Eubacteriales bacterium]